MEAVPPEMGVASILREEPEKSAAGRARQREGAARALGELSITRRAERERRVRRSPECAICAGKFQGFDRFEAAMRGRVDI